MRATKKMGRVYLRAAVDGPGNVDLTEVSFQRNSTIDSSGSQIREV
jgi:hypothetical protein